VKKTVLVGILFGIAVLGAIIYSSMGLRSHRVEVCMEFRGQRSCRTASGASREVALRTAVENACALTSSGVTDTIACGNTPPSSIRWLEGK
jgi:hypothetical protein